jgi:tetratricopeptide (TPR) repeat protein
MAGRSHSRTLVLAFIGLALAWAAWRVLGLGMADHFARHDPMRALWWRPHHPIALVSAAEQVAGRDPARAAALARAALAANPAEGRAYRVLGQLADARGDRIAAERLFESAATRAPRDLPTHEWLERHYITQGKIAPALHHIDLGLRIEPALMDRQFPVLIRLAGIPQAQADLARFLGRKPPWREGFITVLCQRAPDIDALAGFMRTLDAQGGGWSATELNAWLERLVAEHRWGDAYGAWASALSASQRSHLSNVFNGGFEDEPSGSGFDWRFGAIPGAYIERLATTGAEGRFALRVSFDDRRVPFEHVRQLLALPPGKYRLSGRARAEGLRSERGLLWRVSCAEDGHELGATAPVVGFTPWRETDAAFEIPATGCGGQWLALVLPARIPAEQRIGGRAWFDSIRIRREP